ncbi:MAG: hypothetical protein RL556_546 [Actinomycetota bacterium]|jgi:predicted neutral ceramidase superfamily lipid hydrolase
METISGILVVLHLIGVAALLGGFLTQIKDLKTGGRITPSMFHGAWTLLVTGFALIGTVMASPDETINNYVLTAKAIIITVIFFVAYGYNRRATLPKWVLPLIGALTVANMALAVLGPIVVPK